VSKDSCSVFFGFILYVDQILEIKPLLRGVRADLGSYYQLEADMDIKWRSMRYRIVIGYL
jgi:hypothetical protein